MATIVTSGSQLVNFADTLTLTESSENTMLPAENVLNGRPGTRWETGSSSENENLVIDLGSPAGGTHFGFLKPEGITQTSSVTLEGNATDSWGSPSLSVALSSSGVKSFSPDVYRYWRFVFTKSSAGTAAQFSAFFLGGSTTFPVMEYDGYNEDRVDRSSTIIAEGGSYTDQRLGYLRFTCPYSDITNVEKTTILGHWDTYGTHTAFYFQADDTELTTWYYVKYAEPPRFENTGHDGSNLLWSTTLTFNQEINT